MPAAKEKKPKKPSLSERLDRIESALRIGLGLDLEEFDPQAAVSARADAFNKAAEQMAKIAEKAAADIAEPLTEEQRIERLEAALRSGGSLA